MSTARHKWMASKVTETFNVQDNGDNLVETFFGLHSTLIDEWLAGKCENQSHVLLFYDMRPEDPPQKIGAPPLPYQAPDLHVSTTPEVNNQRKACYFLRQSDKPINCKFATDATVTFGELLPGLLTLWKSSVEKVFAPILREKDDWGQANNAKECGDFLDQTDDFVAGLERQLGNLKGEVELRMPMFDFSPFELKPAVYTKLAAHKELITESAVVLKEWADKVRAYLNTQNTVNLADLSPSEGPKVEIEYWGRKMLTLQSILDQLKTKPGRGVLGVFGAYVKSVRDDTSANSAAPVASKDAQQVLTYWQDTDALLTDALNEAADNVKFLSNLDKFLEPLYKGTPAAIADALPSLMSAMKMIHTLSRHYGTAPRMTALFLRMTNEMITCCKRNLYGNARGQPPNPALMWQKDPVEIIAAFRGCVDLMNAYKREYTSTKEKLAAMPKGRQFNFDDVVIFARFKIFCKRLEKLIDMFESLQQYNLLKEAEVDGMEELMQNYGTLLIGFQKKNHDLLDYENSVFERDFVEFMMSNSQIESDIQTFIDKSFSAISSIMSALKLLANFRRLLLRPSLSADLDTKFLTIFTQYGAEVQRIEEQYTRECNRPPLARNAPFVTGAISWARQLLDRIYGPMQVFTQHPHVFVPKENKKIVKQFNKLAKVLMQFELVHYQEWCRSVEKIKVALEQPLFVRRKPTGADGEVVGLDINLDASVFTMIKEARNLKLMGFKDLPEAALMVLRLEPRLKSSYDVMRNALIEYQQMQRVSPVLRVLIRAPLADLDLALRPGLTTVSWTSMNVDTFAQTVESSLYRFKMLVNQMTDFVENRLVYNLNQVEQTLLLNLESIQPSSLDNFTAMQEKAMAAQTKVLVAKNVEIERAVDDLISVINAYPVHATIVRTTTTDLNKVKAHYCAMLYKAVLHCVQNSLEELKKRVTFNKERTFADGALFEVELQLVVPEVRISPTLAQVQTCVNGCVAALLQSSRALLDWGIDSNGVPTERASFYNRLASDKSIVVMMLMMTGSVEQTKTQMAACTAPFTKLSWLWMEDPEKKYKEFAEAIQTETGDVPTLEDFTRKLGEFKAVENEIAGVTTVQTLGCLFIKPETLKEQLKAECNRWKMQFSEKLHKEAKAAMDAVLEKMKLNRTRMQAEIKDLPTLKAVMDVFAELRSMQTWIEMEFNRVFDMYAQLEKSFPPGSGYIGKEEMDNRSILKPTWKTILQEADQMLQYINSIKDGYRVKLLEDSSSMVSDVKQFRADYLANGPMVQGIAPDVAMTRLNKFTREFEALDRNDKIFSAGQRLFGIPVTLYPELVDTAKELTLLNALYGLWKEVIVTIEEYKGIMWSDVTSNVQVMTETVEKFQQKCKTLPKALRGWPAFVELQTTVDGFIEILPLLTDLSKPSMKARHWAEIMAVTGKEFKLDQDTKLRSILDLNLLEGKEEIEEIVVSADKQKGIEDKLRDIKEVWDKEAFEFAPWKERGMVVLFTGKVGVIIEKLEESQATLSQLLTMKHITPFKDVTDEWNRKLGDVAEVLENWLKVQQNWGALEGVFLGGDIARQMPQDAKKFSKYDKEWTTRLMPKAKELSNVVLTCQDPYIKGILPEIAVNLDQCQKALDGYLETKRQAFPRFYFVSNPALLIILSQGTDLVAVQQCFQKVFDSITNVNFKGNQITKYMSVQSGFDGKMDSEDIECTKPVAASGNIEDWLGELEQEMMNSMRKLCLKCSTECDTLPLADFIRVSCGQFALLGIQFSWTHDVEAALKAVGTGKAKGNAGALNSAARKTGSLLIELANLTTTDIPTKQERTKIETLVTIQVHARDVLNVIIQKFKAGLMLTENTQNDFEWQKQARFYWNSDIGDCEIKVADTSTVYCHEFLGSKERLAITPLTDRCYISLTQALQMFFGGAPAGPAGTGKTETVKDLGRTLGKYVVVFNCGPEMRYTDTAKLFKGLCMSGSWGCFDEFNRIELEVLSVVAQQVACICNAKRMNVKTFSFPDSVELVNLDVRSGQFITMNPGYAGRQELPENLKALFRGVTMMVPDFEIIIKVKLASVGYTEYEPLAKKFRVLYDLCKEQLSKQRHYDFGLRNILSVLRTAGANLRAELDLDKASSVKRDRQWLEEMLLMRTLRDMNVSKFVADDVELFKSLLRDLFPKQGNPDSKQFPEEEAGLRYISERDGLIFHPSWVLKMIQLYETSLVRHGLMMVGPAGAGKSKAIETLLDALTHIERPHKFVRMNPKAITAQEMFGENDRTSGEWTHGVFSSLWTRYNDLTKPYRSWILCDGPVDAVWIENLNTVLDDNKLLTLANGDRLPMTDNCKILFEAEDLRNASPATVSRAGIVFVSKESLGWMPLVESWLLKRRPEEQAVLRALYMKYVEDSGVMDFMLKNLRTVMIVSTVHMVTNLLNLITGLLAKSVTLQVVYGAEEMERIFIYAVAWAIGGLYEDDHRRKFSDFIGKIAGAAMPKNDTPDKTLFDYFIEPEAQKWQLWKAPVWNYPRDSVFRFSSILVPTMDSCRAEYLISMIHGQNKSVMVIGGSGTAKSATVYQFTDKFKSEEMMLKKINFSSATTPRMFQLSIDSDIEKKTGKTFGPPGGRRMTIFLDDVSMPEVNKWGDQPTLELVRQVVADETMYFLEKDRRGDAKKLDKIQYIGAMSHPGGGRNDIPNRFKRHFFTFNMPPPSTTAIDNIYGSMLRGRYADNEEFFELVEPMTSATIQLWQKVKTKMLPTPAKFHYVFNMRDLSRVFQGVLHAPMEVLDSSKKMLALWKHECCRVFSDKLISLEDKKWFDNTFESVIREKFGESVQADLKPEIFYVDCMRDDVIDPETDQIIEEAPKIYEFVPDMITMRARMDGFLNRHNDIPNIKKMDLVLFDDAIRHLVRISRIIGMPRGSALLVGVGGSGKQSLTRLAAYIARHVVCTITITKFYKVADLMEDLRQIYIKVGKEGKKVTFVFTDSMIIMEDFLEYINAVLATGEVAGLFSRDERDMMASDMRPIAKKEIPGFNDTQENLARFLSDRIRDNLHVVLCFSPVNAKFKERARRFPSLISGCVIDWFLPWPADALISVAGKFIRDPKFTVDCDDEAREKLIAFIGNVHEIVVNGCNEYLSSFRRYVYVTPKSFLSFIASYKVLYGRKFEYLSDQERRVRVGLQKLQQATTDVEQMKIDLAKKKKSLIVAEKNANEFLEKLTVSSAEAQVKAEKAAVIATGCEAEAARIGADRAIAEKQLAEALPFVEAAQHAAKSITKDDISFVTKLNNPPLLIKIIMDCVLLLQNRNIEPVVAVDVEIKKGVVQPWIKDSYDTCAKPMMSSTAFLPDLMYFGEKLKDNINDETIELLAPYLAIPDFNGEEAAKKANAAKGLCLWARAMNDYTFASKVVKPRLLALSIAQANLDKAMATLAAANAEKNAAEAIVNDLKIAFEKLMAEKAAIALDAKVTENRMEAANELITSLAGERIRWNDDCNTFADMKRRLIGDCAIACAFVSYCGPFNEAFRAKLQGYFFADCTKKGIPGSADLALTKFLVDESTVAEWNNQGLPKDDLSIQNGILVTQASRFPLLIDPQAQAVQWIREREAANMPYFGLTTIAHPRFRDYLGYALSEGKPLIIEGIENEVDPALDPVLEKNIVRKGRSASITVGDKNFEYNEKFFMYLITKLSNPHFSPELSAKTTVIDFSVTQKGLENQLLSRVLQEEQAALEEQRQNLIKDVNTNTINLKNLDRLLLERLSASQGNLLEDTALIQVLRDTKTKAQEVKEKIASSVETEIMINKKREQYRPVATRGSIMYFVIVDLQQLNWMYQTSLAQFLQWFDFSIKDSAKDRLPAKRVLNIIDYQTFFVYRNIVRGVFERDKVTFKIMLAIRILSIEGKNDTKLTTDLVDLLLKGGAMLPPDDHKPFDWLAMNAWLNATQLSLSLETFRDLITSIRQNEKAWKSWYMESAPESIPIPIFEDRFTGHPMGKYLRWMLVRSLRDDRTIVSSSGFIADALGPKYVEPITVTLDAVWADASANTPVLLLLSPGADPTAELEALARKKKVEIRSVSMGEGQEPNAKKAIEMAATSGDFALLQNCHLGLGFMAKVVDIVDNLKEQGPVDPNFRLWITCEPNPLFPISVLQRAIKVTNEPPQGMKAGMLRSFSTMVDQDRLNRHENNTTWQGLLYAICFVHSIVQERRKFGPIGFNIPYEFNNGDLDASLLFLERHIQANKANVQWSTVQYMVCEVQYGGRITDDLDRFLFNTYGSLWMAEAVLKDNYIFSDVGFSYKMLKTDNIEVIRNFVSTMPQSDSPEVFGLHPNADLTFGTAAAMYMLTAIQETQPKEGGGGGGKTREELVYEIAQELLEKQVPPSYDMEQVRKEMRKRPRPEIEFVLGKNAPKDVDGLTIPLNVFLFQEIERLNFAINNVRKTLIELQQAIRGETIVTPDLQAALDLIYMAKPPRNWYTAPAGDLIAWVSPSLALWMTGLLERDKQLRTWLGTGRPVTYWLTGFFNPQGFLTAMRQEVTRKHEKESWALDDMMLHADVLDQDEPKRLKGPADEGVYIHGLFLEGCVWDKAKKQLAESAPKELFSALPILWITALTSEKRKTALGNKLYYNCPIYTQTKRTGQFYVSSVTMRTDRDPQHWTLRGVALLCDTSLM